MSDNNIDNLVPLPTGNVFRDYCLQNGVYVRTLLNILLNPHKSLANNLKKHLPTIKSYIAGGQSFDAFCHQGHTLIDPRLTKFSLSFSSLP